MGPVGYFKRAGIDAFFLHPLEFFNEDAWVNNYSVADYTSLTFI
ncbi:hypothetical protein SDC9_200408 [bioreactor metagenome]|uniref:Uncharacterized protein n=1 Tax=bioreactor metagenome TaxID=1076179 RepID=A0A645INW9_9ZZZZ